MNQMKRIKIGLLAAALILAMTLPAWAQDIKARMRARLPIIVGLKAQAIVGEDNQGFLAILKSTDQKAVVEAENSDRRMIYKAIAQKQGTSPALVGQRRAMQIAQKADPGTMIQDPSGAWRQK